MKIRKYVIARQGLMHTFDTFCELAQMFRQMGENSLANAAIARTQKDARFSEGIKRGLDIAAEYVAEIATAEQPAGSVQFFATPDEITAITGLRNGTHMVVRKDLQRTMTLAEFFEQEEDKARERYEKERKG
jgi:hypothetical protein